jgi:glucose-1-phosphate thymidylyltransferase
VGYQKEKTIEHYGDEFEGAPITYAHQRKQNGLAHALLTVEEHIDDDFSDARRQPLPSES